MHTQVAQVVQGDLGRWLVDLGIEGEELEEIVGRFIRPGIGVKDLLDLHTHIHARTQCIHMYVYDGCMNICVCKHLGMYSGHPTNMNRLFKPNERSLCENR